MTANLDLSLSVSSLVELMTTNELITGVKELFVELEHGRGTLRLRLDTEETGDRGDCLVLQESMANVLCLLKLERRKRKIAEALLKSLGQVERQSTMR